MNFVICLLIFKSLALACYLPVASSNYQDNAEAWEVEAGEDQGIEPPKGCFQPVISWTLQKNGTVVPVFLLYNHMFLGDDVSLPCFQGEILQHMVAKNTIFSREKNVEIRMLKICVKSCAPRHESVASPQGHVFGLKSGCQMASFCSRTISRKQNIS